MTPVAKRLLGAETSKKGQNIVGDETCVYRLTYIAQIPPNAKMEVESFGRAIYYRTRIDIRQSFTVLDDLAVVYTFGPYRLSQFWVGPSVTLSSRAGLVLGWAKFYSLAGSYFIVLSHTIFCSFGVVF